MGRGKGTTLFYGEKKERMSRWVGTVPVRYYCET